MKFKIYSSGYVKTTTKGQAWIPAFLTIGFLIAFPVAELIMLGNWFGMEYSTEQIAMLYDNLWKDGFLITGFVVGILAAVFNGISQFWYLYSSRKVDFYHCLPVKRSQLYLHRIFTGILYYAVPYLVMEFLAICIGAMRGFFSLHLMKLAFFMFLLHLMLYLMVYFTIVLVICLTGNMLMGGLLLLGAVFYGPVLGVLFNGYETSFFTANPGIFYGVSEALTKYVTPIRLGFGLVENYAEGNYKGLLLACVVVTGVFAVAAYTAFVKRQSERTGKALVFRFTEEIVRFLVVIPVGLGIGYIFYLLPDNSICEPWWIFGMVLGTVLAHGILEVIYRMDFRKFFSHKLALLAAGAVVALCAAVFRFDLLGYDSYVPKYENLQDITINLNAFGNESFDYITKGRDGRYSINNFEDEAIQMQLGYSLGNSQDVYKNVKKIAASSLKYQEKLKKGDYREEVSYTFLNLQYKLKSGRSVYRTYRVENDRLRELLLAGYRDGALKQQKYSFLELDPSYLYQVSATFADGSYYSIFQEDEEKQKALLEAFRKDVEEADAEVLTGRPCVILEFNYKGIPIEQKVTNLVPGSAYTVYSTAYVYVYPEFKRTLAVLTETGYPLSVDELPVQSVEVRYYTKDDYSAESELVVYSSEEEVEEIKKELVCASMIPSWLENYTGFSYLNVKIKGAESERSFWIEECPEFMQEDAEKAKQGLLGEKEEATEEKLTENTGEIEVIEESGVPAEEES